MAKYLCTYAPTQEAVAQAFLCYKAGMTHIIAKDLEKKSPTHNMDVRIPVTILDCPPLTVFGIRAYVKGYNGDEALTDVFAEKLDKDLERAMQVPKEVKDKKESPEAKRAAGEKKIEDNMSNIIKFMLLAHTQPRKSGLGKKKPSIMELGIGGDIAAQWAYAKEMLGKEVSITDVFSDSDMVDIIAVTKGKGFQGPVKRWGIKLQKRKAKRAGHMRHVGSVGGWKPATLSWLTPMAGQMGYHNRTEFNKLVMKLGEKGEEVTPEGGFVGYGLVKGQYAILKGSIPGPKKRAIALRKSIRPGKAQQFAIDYIAKESQQGS